MAVVGTHRLLRATGTTLFSMQDEQYADFVSMHCHWTNEAEADASICINHESECYNA